MHGSEDKPQRKKMTLNMEIACHSSSLTAPGFSEKHSALPRSVPFYFEILDHILLASISPAFPFQGIILREYIPRTMGNDLTVQKDVPQLLLSSRMFIKPCKLGFVAPGMLQFSFICCE